jgi:hypothetical protein
MRAGLVALSILCACGRGDEVATAFAPRVVEVAPPAAWVEGEVHDAVAHAHWLVNEPSAHAPQLRLRVALLEAVAPGGAPLLRVETVADLPEAYEARFGASVDAVVEVESTTGRIDPREHGALAIDRAVAVLDAKVGLALDGEHAVATVLEADDGQIAGLGLDWVAAHRARSWADAVAELVDHPDPLVGLRAIECLALVGGPEHVDALVKRPRLSDRAYARRVYDTLAVLGGPTAQGFLEFAARNEDDPELAEAAARALTQVQGNAGRAVDLGAGVRGHR